MGQSGFDLIADLESISLENTNGFDFYQKIVKTVGKMKDRHQLFIPPFLSDYFFVLPFSIIPYTSWPETKYRFTGFSSFTNSHISDGYENVSGYVC
jgi:hypothetical protein